MWERLKDDKGGMSECDGVARFLHYGRNDNVGSAQNDGKRFPLRMTEKVGMTRKKVQNDGLWESGEVIFLVWYDYEKILCAVEGHTLCLSDFVVYPDAKYKCIRLF
jgi:hypothetical protein